MLGIFKKILRIDLILIRNKNKGDFMKVITLCGSLRFQKEMMKIAQEEVLKGNCVLTPTYPINKSIKLTEEKIKKLRIAHFKRIELSDEVLVININNYIGESTKLEIEYAKKLGKGITYYVN